MYTLTRRCCRRRPSTKRRKLAAVLDSRMRWRVSAPCVMRYVLGVSIKPAERTPRGQPPGGQAPRGLGTYAPSQRDGMKHGRVRHDDQQVGPLVQVLHNLKVVQRGLRRAVVVCDPSGSRVGARGVVRDNFSTHAQAAKRTTKRQRTDRLAVELGPVDALRRDVPVQCAAAPMSGSTAPREPPSRRGARTCRT